MKTAGALQTYLLLAKALRPLWQWLLKKRLARGKETPQSLLEKWVVSPPPRPSGPLVWGHAVGVGEAMALYGLFQNISKRWPQAHFLITTTARTSGDALHKNGLQPGFTHQFSPVDTPETVRRFLDHWQPSLAVWCEMDLWPALLHATAQRRIPHALVNARLEPAALAKRRWGRWLYQALLPSFSTLWAQNEEARQGLIALGAPADKVVVTGTIKAMSAPLRCDEAQHTAWQQALSNRPVWLLASSHPPEEALALQVHQLLLLSHPNALLLISPRDPHRGPEIAQLCTAPSLLRSQTNALPAHEAVYIADTIGDMGLWYRLAPIAMLGGSWAPIGGHNPHEPLALACQVVHGPHVWNFAESYQALAAPQVCEQAAEVQAIADKVLRAWQQPMTQATTPAVQTEAHVQALINLAR
jgi:3-deoxy-D-manno-octulosonic-acid transferase